MCIVDPKSTAEPKLCLYIPDRFFLRVIHILFFTFFGLETATAKQRLVDSAGRLGSSTQ